MLSQIRLEQRNLLSSRASPHPGRGAEIPAGERNVLPTADCGVSVTQRMSELGENRALG